MFTHAQLHARLLGLEWSQEKQRLVQLLVAGAFAFASATCLLLFTGIAALSISWDTPYRLPTALAAMALYGLTLFLCWRKFCALTAADAFAATRAELAADLALLRSKL